ncbi:MAG: hypothetical protein LBJ67_08625 [Planctomycetaceae bacterium]|jgi:hypothetical protein|nr:hypothetical protein [Planctomycetaceae bacterium]
MLSIEAVIIRLIIVFVAFVGMLFLLIKFRNQGTSLGRAIIGLILIGIGTIIMTIVYIKSPNHTINLSLIYYPLFTFTSVFIVASISLLHVIVGYLVLISALFCNNKKKD